MTAKPLLAGLLLVSLASLSATAAEPRELFEARVYRDEAGKELPYRLLLPRDYHEATRYPLVLFLHGAGERGNDNEKQLVHGMKDFASDAAREKYPALVVAPQCPEGLWWSQVNLQATRQPQTEQASEPLRLALELVDALGKEYSVDPDRIYITGLSMGGFGTWDAVARYPEKFAAAIPICGGGDTEAAPRLKGLPLWVFHGAKDGVVKPELSRGMVEAIREAGGEPKYTEYPDAAHDSWTATYGNPEVHAWLFAQRRKQEK